MGTPTLASPCFHELSVILPSTVATLQNRENLQDVQEEVEYGDEDGHRQPDGIGQRIRHIFGTLHMDEDIAGEDGNTKEGDDQTEKAAIEQTSEEDADHAND